MIIRDVSERKKAEALLLSSEQKFSEIFYNNQAMMAIVSVSGHRFIDINNAALIAFGFNAEEIIGKSLLELNL
jgi:PAS domain S-box-containing protein